MHEGVSVLPTTRNYSAIAPSPGIWHSRSRLSPGKLELMTWEWTDPDLGRRIGWGSAFIEEAEDVKRRFEVEYKGKRSLLFKKRPQAFRWTCCGTHARMKFGCDHHGSGSKPCTCDFCQ